MSHEWFSTHQRDMNGFMESYEVEQTLDQRITFVIAELTEGDLATKVTFPVGIASRTAQWTLTRDFNGKDRRGALAGPCVRPSETL
jgi:hypothetical protein